MIKPISEYGRVPEQGRIRYGVKTMSANGKVIPKSILKFRFTSADMTGLQQIALLYGGEIKPWEKGQYEVISAASEIPIILPPDPLHGGPVYEMWTGSACVRRCNGVIATVPVQGPEGSDLCEVECLCAQEGALSCKATTRLSVILPDVRFGGLWRLDCKGKYGAEELPAMVEMAQMMQNKGLSRAFLALVPRERRNYDKNGKPITNKFVVPMIRMDDSANQMEQRQLGYVAPRQIEAGEPDVFDA